MTKTYATTRGQSVLTFSTGLFNLAGVVTAKLSTGFAGSQSVIGGTASGETLTLSSTSHATKGKILFGTSAYDEVNNYLGLGQTVPTARLDVTTNALGATAPVASGIALVNTTAAALNAQQWTPTLRFSSKGWGTTASTSQSVDWMMYSIPIQGAVPTAALQIHNSIAGGAYAYKFSLTTDGSITIPNNIYCARVIANIFQDVTGNNSFITVSGTSPNQVLTIGNGGINNITFTPAAATTTTFTNTALLVTRPAGAAALATGILLQNATAGTSGVPVQWSPSYYQSGTAWTGAASQVAIFGTVVKPVSGTTPITANWVLQSNINAAGYVDLISISDTGKMGIGVATPTAMLHIKAGTATANTAPLKLTSGTNLTTTEAGAIEYNGTHLYFTAANAGTRYQLDQQSEAYANPLMTQIFS